MDLEARKANWLQFAILLLAVLAMGLHAEGRMATVEQAQRDTEKQLEQLQSQINRLDDKVAEWSRTLNRYQTTP